MKCISAPPMIVNSGPLMHRPLQTISNKTWSSGSVPSVWKHEHKLYIPKPDKTDYHIEKAYRGLSFTSIVGKLMDKIVKTRFYIWLEENHILDQMQTAYRQDENITEAMLSFVLCTFKCFSKGETTIAVFMDLEGAFDAVWWDAVIFKLYEMV